jgi:uncharacterized membrane protein YccC
MMDISAVAVTLIIGTILPVLVGLITKLDASSKLKGGILLVLNATQGLIVASRVSDGGASFTVDALVLFIAGVAVSLLSYYGFYKPNDVSAKLAPDFGIGGSTSPVENPPA